MNLCSKCVKFTPVALAQVCLGIYIILHTHTRTHAHTHTHTHTHTHSHKYGVFVWKGGGHHWPGVYVCI